MLEGRDSCQQGPRFHSRSHRPPGHGDCWNIFPAATTIRLWKAQIRGQRHLPEPKRQNVVATVRRARGQLKAFWPVADWSEDLTPKQMVKLKCCVRILAGRRDSSVGQYPVAESTGRPTKALHPSRVG